MSTAIEHTQKVGMGFFITILALTLGAFQLYTAATLPFAPIAQRGLHLALALMIVFIIYDIKGMSGRKQVPWYDIVLIVLITIVMLYAVLQARKLSMPLRMANPNLIDQIFSIIAVVLVLEGARRVTGWAFPIMTIITLVYAMLGPDYLPKIIWHPGVTLRDFAAYMYMSTDGIFGSSLGASTNLVYIFILFGCFLQASKAGDFFSDSALSLFGTMRGGPAKVAVFSSALFGTISGSAVANVAVDGPITISMMKRTGYDPCFAAAVEASASTGGQIMPPVMGAAAFIMAEIIGVPYLTIAKSAIIPALLYFFAVYVSIDLEAAKTGLKGLSRTQLPRFGNVMRQRGHMLIPLAVMIYLLIVLGWEAESTAFWSILVVVGISFLKMDTRLNWPSVLYAFNEAARAILSVATACACAGIMIAVFESTALSARLATLLVTISGGNMLFLLFLTMIASLLLGMPLPTTPAYIVLAILIAPALVRAGLTPLSAHFFVFYFACMAPVTPPIALASYTAAGIAGADINKTGWISWSITLPSFIVPYMFIYGPELLLAGGTAGSIFLALMSAVIGVIGMGSAIRGYFFTNLTLVERCVVFVGSSLLMYVGWITDLIGFITLGVVMIINFLRRERLLKGAIRNKSGII